MPVEISRKHMLTEMELLMPTGVLDKSVPNQKIDIDSFLRAMVSHRASDLHLSTDRT